MHMCAGTHRNQKRALDALELDLQAGVSHPTKVTVEAGAIHRLGQSLKICSKMAYPPALAVGAGKE